MQEIAAAIQEGATAYLRRQYLTIAVVGVVILALLTFFLGLEVGIGYAIGAVLLGRGRLHRHERLGPRQLAHRRGRGDRRASPAASTSRSRRVRSPACSWWRWACSASRSTTASCWRSASSSARILEALVGLSFGASLISIFARLGGGIFTKGADVGADLVGKVEAGIPEDDPRNPAVIADNVGDNVGDCAGMAADLFETYAVTFVATMLLGAIFFTGAQADDADAVPAGDRRRLPAGLDRRHLPRQARQQQQHHGRPLQGLLGLGRDLGAWRCCRSPRWCSASAPSTATRPPAATGLDIYYCSLVGLGVTGLLMWITDYYTGINHRPVLSIAKSSTTGHGTNIIQGLAVSMEATALPVIVICAGILLAYLSAGLYGIAIAATTMLALTGLVVSLDAYGPVTDNAGGIAEMAGLPSEVRVHTDALDAVGNTTKAVTKGYAIGSAGLAALVLFAAYVEDLKHYFPEPRRPVQPVRPLRRRRPVHRRHAALPVRRHGHAGGRPGRRVRSSRRSAGSSGRSPASWPAPTSPTTAGPSTC